MPFWGALATLAVLTIVTFAWLLSVTCGALMQRAGSGATQPGSPPVTLAVLVTAVVLVLVAFNVTTGWLTAPAATAAVAVHVTRLVVPLPTSGSAEEGVHVQLPPQLKPRAQTQERDFKQNVF